MNTQASINFLIVTDEVQLQTLYVLTIRIMEIGKRLEDENENFSLNISKNSNVAVLAKSDKSAYALPVLGIYKKIVTKPIYTSYMHFACTVEE